MAPRRSSSGGGSSGSSGGGSTSACPYAFKDGGYSYYATPVVYFVNYCLILALTLGVLISLFCIKKRHGNAKKLVGPIYLVSLLCQLIGYVLLIIAVLLRECGTTPYLTYYDWMIVFNIFFKIGNYLLLVVVVWGVNSLLRERLGSGQGMVKIGSLVVLGFMGALTCGYIGLSCYNIWTVTPGGSNADAENRSDDESKLAVAYYVFYLVSVLAAGGSAVATTFAMRSRRLPVGDIFGWVIALFFCMFIWILFTLIELGSYVSDNYFTGDGVYEAFAYIESFFEMFAWIVLLFLAKSRAWDHIMVDDANQDVYVPSAYPEVVQNAPVPHPQQQYAHNGQGGQQYYYQQQPVYNGAPSPMNGAAHEMHAK